MSRPIYESEGDRGHERRIAAAVARAWDCTALKMPMQYRLDFALYRDRRLVAAMEVKRRVGRSLADLDRLGGRADRSDWQDIEPVVLIPVARFEREIGA